MHFSNRILFVLSFCIILHFCNSEETHECDKRFIDKNKEKDTDNPESHRFIYGVNSNGSTAASEIQNHAPSLAGLEVLLKYVEFVRMLQVRKNSSSEQCTEKTPEVIQDRARYFGFGEISDCGSEFTDENSLNATALIQAIEDIDKGIETVYGMRVSRDYQYNEAIGKFRNVYANNVFPFQNDDDSIRVCTAYRAIGYRVNGNWGIGTPFYRYDRYYDATSTRKHFINEFVRMKAGKAVSIPMSIPICGFDLVAEEFENVTAAFERWHSFVDWDHHASDVIEEHYALQNTLAKGSASKELLQDSRAPSNIAIILLPILLTVLPIGLFQDVGGASLAIYAIFTDFISVLPVMIKGFEMLFEGRKEYYSIVSKIYGSANVPEAGVVQIFPAVCRVNSSISIYGITLISIGFVGMIVGVGLEIRTLVLIRKKQKIWKAEWKELMEKGKAKEEKRAELKMRRGLLFYWFSPKYEKLF